MARQELDANLCPACWTASITSILDDAGGYIYSCRRCGKFRIPSSVLEEVRTNNAHPLHSANIVRPAVCHHLRRAQEMGATPMLSADLIQRVVNDPWLPTITDQMHNLLRLIAIRSDGPGEVIEIRGYYDQYIVGTQSPGSIDALLEELEYNRFVTKTPTEGGHLVRATVSGWMRYEAIRRGTSQGRSVFLAMPFGTDLDDTWLPFLRRAVAEAGFNLTRMDDRPQAGIVDVRMRAEIENSRFVIVDLTYANHGAYWEAGYAEGLGKIVFYTCRKGEFIHFDTAHLQRVEWEKLGLDAAAQKLKAMIQTTLPDALHQQRSPSS